MKLDKVGFWSEIKLEIIKEYASAYTSIMAKQSQSWCKGYLYIDAFAGASKHISRRTGEMISGSPLNALEVIPPFIEYHFIDLDAERADVFRQIAKENPTVHAYQGDCNEILITKIFPKLTYNSFKRALCILDPYGLQLKWTTVKAAAELATIEIFINFPVMDINRNILSGDPASTKPEDTERMTVFWGDESWKHLLYGKQENIFGGTDQVKTEDYQALAKEYLKRLKQAGFKDVPNPVLMRNKTKGPLYYLFFASQKTVAKGIVKDIFDKYRKTYAV